MCWLLTEIQLPIGETLTLEKPAVLECIRAPHNCQTVGNGQVGTLYQAVPWAVKAFALDEAIWQIIKANVDYQAWQVLLLEGVVQAYKNRMIEADILSRYGNRDRALRAVAEQIKPELPEGIRLTLYPIGSATSQEKTRINAAFALYKSSGGQKTASGSDALTRSLVKRTIWNEALFSEKSKLKRTLKVRSEQSLQLDLGELLYGLPQTDTITLRA